MGKVFLIAAGCGDPELLTLKAAKILSKANVVLHDRLVAPEILQHIPNNAIVLQTGKQRNAASIAQGKINELIVTYSKTHEVVVRLKGGDLAFFSNVFDELETLHQNKIEFELVPGVTAASGCSAYTGMPLTVRKISDEVHFLSLHNTASLNHKEWKYYASLKGTLVFYMSSASLFAILENLVKHGIAEKKLAVIQQGTTFAQRVFFSTTHQAEQDFKENEFVSPALIVVGDVVELAGKFQWFQPTASDKFFNEIVNNYSHAH